MAMEVRPGETELGVDPPVPPVSRPSAAAGQGQLFPDALAYPTFGDTDQLPSVGYEAARSGPRRSSRFLRVAVALVALAVVAAGAALGLVKAGVIGNNNGSTANGAPGIHNPAQPSPKTSLLTATGAGPGTAAYTIDVPVYSVSVVTSTGRSWVSIGTPGHTPIFQGILAPGATQHQIVFGASQVDIGAGGTKVVVTSNHRSVTLTPPVAPFNYQFTPKA